MEENSTLPDKRAVAETLLTKGNVFLHLDPRKDGVVVPDWLKNQLQLVLQIGHDLPIRIPDLHVNDDGVFATLSFNRSPFTCWVPWDSLFAMVGENGRGMVWINDMPSEIAAEVEREVRKGQMFDLLPRQRTDRKSKRNNKDKGLKESSAATDSPPTEKPSAARTGKRRRVASERAKTEENAIAPPPRSLPSFAVKDNRDSSPPLNRGARKRKIRELPPYLRVIK